MIQAHGYEFTEKQWDQLCDESRETVARLSMISLGGIGTSPRDEVREVEQTRARLAPKYGTAVAVPAAAAVRPPAPPSGPPPRPVKVARKAPAPPPTPRASSVHYLQRMVALHPDKPWLKEQLAAAASPMTPSDLGNQADDGALSAPERTPNMSNPIRTFYELRASRPDIPAAVWDVYRHLTLDDAIAAVAKIKPGSLAAVGQASGPSAPRVEDIDPVIALAMGLLPKTDYPSTDAIVRIPSGPQS
jgi:hypothetical protein